MGKILILNIINTIEFSKKNKKQILFIMKKRTDLLAKNMVKANKLLLEKTE